MLSVWLCCAPVQVVPGRTGPEPPCPKIDGVMCSQSACQEVLVYSFRVLKCSGSIKRINEISLNCSDTIVLTCLEIVVGRCVAVVGSVSMADASPLVCFIQG